MTLLDRHPATRRLGVTAATAVIGDGHREIQAEMKSSATNRSLLRSIEMTMWASAVDGRRPFPKWFPAAHHIRSDAGRRASAVALRSYLEEHPDAGEFLWRQLFAFESDPDLGELSEFVGNDLANRLTRAKPEDAAGVDRGEPPSVVLLETVVAELRGLGLRPFLVSGTLLGHERDRRILAHDYDIDLGLLPGDGDPAVAATALERAGFSVKADERKIVCRDADGAVVDLFVHYERDGLLWHGTDIHEWWNTPFALEPATFMGVEVWVPDDVDRYLTENYGDWSRPVAFYNFSFDTPNRVYRQTPEALLYLHKRFLRALRHGDRWSAESVARVLRDDFDVDVTRFFNPTPLLGSSDRTP